MTTVEGEPEAPRDPEQAGGEPPDELDTVLRIEEVERMQAEAEDRIEEARVGAETTGAVHAGEDGEALLAELQRAEAELQRHSAEEEVIARELVETEERLTETQRQTADALERAVARLEEVESRAAEAEARAEQAERLATLKAEEMERTSRLREVLDRIAAAEQRARTAEERARAAVDRVSQPLEPIDPAEIFDGPTPNRSPGEPHLGADVGTGPALSPVVYGGPPLSLNAVTYEDLRSLGLSGPQADRVLARRERSGPFTSVDELDLIPGFPIEFLEDLKTRLVV